VNIDQAMQEASALCARGRWADAEQRCRAVVGVQPSHAGALSLLSIIAVRTQRPQEAADWSRRAIGARPNDSAILGNHATLMMEIGRLDEALAGHDRLIGLQPTLAEAHLGRGAVLHKLGRIPEALASYEQALALKPEHAQAHYNRGVALRALGRLDDALASYDRALAARPNHAGSHNNRGIVLQELGRPLEALLCYERSIAISPQDAQAHCNRGMALAALARPEEALGSYERALALKPNYAQAHAQRGHVLRELRRLDESLASYGQALALEPGYAEAHLNLGILLHQLERVPEGLESMQRALQLRPDHVESHVALGNALMRLHRPEDARDHYARALALAPQRDWLYGNWLHARAHLCDWRDFAQDLAQLLREIELGRRVILPFYALSLTDAPDRQREAAQTFVNARYPASLSMPALRPRSPDGKVRLGYYSADFHEHATAQLTAGLFEHHDRTRFELTAFSFGPARQDETRQRLAAAFDRFVDVRAESDRNVALLSRQLEIDIAIDLKGFTAEARAGIFAHRAAPVQASYLGYPGTMGASYMDYLIADPMLIPPGSQRGYSEKIAYLPHSYQANDRRRPIAERSFSREELGLPAEGFVFCCFNNSYKITPESFDIWMRILTRTPGSVLWLLTDSAITASNLRMEAAARGVEGARLVFADRLPTAEHLARHRAANLFLDTLPYNAHTTASDALWAGLPVLTRRGESFAGRVAASLLAAVSLPELITTTSEAYETLAIELASKPDRLAEHRGTLDRSRLTMPLFDTELFTRHLEDAYAQMHERSRRGLDPEHLYIQPDAPQVS
jgi:protein O-GlcNAc transferase